MIKKQNTNFNPVRNKFLSGANGVKLLILTQRVDINDDVLGFMPGWLDEFSKQCDKVIVVCLQKGEYILPANVKVLSLGKESGKSRLKYTFNFYKYIWQERGNYDKVFVHMNTEYVILGGIVWRILRKKIALWYVHKKVGLKLYIAEKLANVIFTASLESFRIKSKKLKVLGHGIDIIRFNKPEPGQEEMRQEGACLIITGGRISPIKNYETLILAAEILQKKGLKFKINIFGEAPLIEQKKYLEDLKQLVAEKKLDKVVQFLGRIANRELAKYFLEADIFVHTSLTGSLDKVVLEAMACYLPVLTCSDGLNSVLGVYKEALMFTQGDYKELAKKIEKFLVTDAKDRLTLGKELRQIVVKNHDVKNLIGKIIYQLSK